MPQFVLTAPMVTAATEDLRHRITRALQEYPELGDRTVTVGLTTMRGVDGLAVADEMLIRLNAKRRLVTFFTIGHELTHLLQRPGLGVVPSGEVQCDIWTLARSDLFLDEKPTYLPVGCDTRDWHRHASSVRRLCREAIAIRERNRYYIRWLTSQLDQHFAPPTTLPFESDSPAHSRTKRRL